MDLCENQNIEPTLRKRQTEKNAYPFSKKHTALFTETAMCFPEKGCSFLPKGLSDFSQSPKSGDKSSFFGWQWQSLYVDYCTFPA